MNNFSRGNFWVQFDLVKFSATMLKKRAKPIYKFYFHLTHLFEQYFIMLSFCFNRYIISVKIDYPLHI